MCEGRVARMERSAIWDSSRSCTAPDCAALHPGYSCAAIFSNKAINASGAVTFGEWLASSS
jgi:hypothetical protein